MSLSRLGIRVDPERAELALARLLPLMPSGAEERRSGEAVEFALYGPAADLPGEDAVRRLAGDAVLSVALTPVAPGWEDEWQRFLRPVAVTAGGRTVRVRAPWHEPADAALDLSIDPGRAFGAGTHPSTVLAVELLLGLAPAGALCDWGTGTGLLAVAAARLGWSPVSAVDLDSASLEIAKANADRNRVSVCVKRCDLMTEQPPPAETVLANLTAPLLVHAARTVEVLPQTVVVSGFLAGRAAEVAAAWAERGLTEQVRRERDGWAALVARG